MVGSIFENVHAQRLDALANYSAATMRALRVTIHAIGAAYAETAEIKPKHGIKQLDRFLSNPNFNVEALRPLWAKFVLGSRKRVHLALDWTEFDDDDHATLAAYVLTSHGRATPLAWKTVKKSQLKGKRTAIEHAFVEALHEDIAKEIEIVLTADRGFGDQKLYELLDSLGWDYVIRFRGGILVEHEGQSKPASEWLSPTGRARKLSGARVTQDRAQVGAVVVVHAKNMKEPWCLATSQDERASTTVKTYGRRFRIEETFRDQKDLRFGLGLRATHIRSAARRDRLLMLIALAHGLLTLLGAASERAGMDAYLRANTVKRRTHSLFRQGAYWYGCIPTMRDDWFEDLMRAFTEVLHEHKSMGKVLAAI
jgi:Transposase DDE domain